MEIKMTIGKMPDGSDRLDGFKYFWVKYVNGFDPKPVNSKGKKISCQAQLIGKLDTQFMDKHLKINHTYELSDPGPASQIYICADPYKQLAIDHLATLTDWKKAVYPYPGLQLALQPKEGETVQIQTYNGVNITITNVRRLEIPYLPDGFAGYAHLYTSCCVWQFGVAQYGLSKLNQ